ncbi:MAG: hypothetical protein E7598_01260 [Ruminococcaceae bacterium]|nr:hypothetical protein [Oscillospiraceae bacterium]
MGLEQDYLGGIFGIERGCNSYSILLFAIVLSKSLLLYMEGKEGAVSCFAKCGCALVLAAMAELKLFFLIFVFILVFSSILTRFSVRKFVMLFVSALLLFVASSVLTSVFGMAQELSFDRIVQLVTATNYASAEDLGRFTALPTISKTILTDVSDKIFGMGLGNCDTSAFAICNTPFFETHQKLHYTWFSSAFLFLETGYIGLTLNLTFYVICCLISFKLFKNGKSDRLFCQLGMIVSLLAIIMVFYNSSLRTEAGYMVYFVLSLPLVASREWSGAAISEKTIKN